MSEPCRIFHIDLPDADATDALAARFAVHLDAPDSVLLHGPIGAGKTHFARAVIRALTHAEQDVPSPTYTLMQGYEAVRSPIWHLDLYRLGDVDELAELGLDTLFEDAISLIEWPERLGGMTPARHVAITLEQAGEGRRATILMHGTGWDALERELSQ